MIEYNDQLIVGGFFDTAGGIAANNIAAWDDSAWSTLGSGMNGAVNALIVHQGQLYAGGNFSTAGGNAASNLAVWDGSSWSEVQGGTNGPVYALASHFEPQSNLQYNLLVGGDFTQAGNQSGQNFAMLSSNNIWFIGLDYDEPVLALSYDSINTNTYIGGKFKHIKSIPLSGINVFNGYSSPAINEGVKIDDTVGSVNAIAVHGGKVYFGGQFDEIGGVPAANIGSNTGYEPFIWGLWDSCSCGTSGGPITSPVQALISFDNQLIAGGYFREAGGVTANHIAAWNGSSWSAFGSGVDGAFWPHVWALATYKGKLIAGGRFTTAGGESVNNIAVWELK